MPLQVVTRTRKPAEASRIPDALKLGSVVLAGFRRDGLFDRIEEWFPLSRRGGHGARSLFTLAVVYLLAGRRSGIRPFIQEFATALRRIAAPLVGLRELPSAAAMSRALGDPDHAAVRGCVDRLLTADPRIRALLGNPHVQHRDAHGQGWHVLDIDPTITAFRQRSLPDDSSMPTAVRRAPGVPGYVGHKRGDIRIRHVPLQHAGCGLWLGYRLEATGDSILPRVAEVVRGARGALAGCDGDGRVVVRADGEFGSVGAMRTCLDAGVHVLTRLARYSLLDREDVASAMVGAVWREVPSGGGGPARQATDLGLFLLHPSESAAASEGGPVEVRVVATRFARSGTPDHGVMRDGFQVELFATSLPADAWPAADLVALYFGRGAIENRFAQEDREFGIDRTFSFHPPGQEWMSGIALFLWNILVVRGVAAHPLPAELPVQAPRPPEPAPLPGPSPVPDAPSRPSLPEPSSPPPSPAPAAAPPVPAAAPSPSQPKPPSRKPLLPSTRAEGSTESGLRQELWSITRAAFADLPATPGWRLDDARGEIRCPNDRRLSACGTETEKIRRSYGISLKSRLVVRTDAGACDGCPVRTACTSSERPHMTKQVTRALSAADTARADALIRALREFKRPKIVRPAPPRRLAPVPVGTRPEVHLPPQGFTRLPMVTAGPLIPRAPLFLPAESRTRARALVRGLRLDFHVRPAAAIRELRHPLLARDAAARQHRRLTFRQRADRWLTGHEATLLVRGPGASQMADGAASAKQPGQN